MRQCGLRQPGRGRGVLLCTFTLPAAWPTTKSQGHCRPWQGGSPRTPSQNWTSMLRSRPHCADKSVECGMSSRPTVAGAQTSSIYLPSIKAVRNQPKTMVGGTHQTANEIQQTVFKTASPLATAARMRRLAETAVAGCLGLRCRPISRGVKLSQKPPVPLVPALVGA